MNLRIDQKHTVKQIPVLVYSRVSGYYNPVANFNKGKREEFYDRKYLNIGEFVDACTGDKTGL
ncbi:MAG: hypothetical protein BWY70_01808 [Bacteroidetes bacterium ADurb.Bin408]|nr:MAG: hypothetical protein BWY70_01808 [Bacteroidetes bacterium ADurb.Bin408]